MKVEKTTAHELWREMHVKFDGKISRVWFRPPHDEKRGSHEINRENILHVQCFEDFMDALAGLVPARPEAEGAEEEFLVWFDTALERYAAHRSSMDTK